jgi:hypothetical protein
VKNASKFLYNIVRMIYISGLFSLIVQLVVGIIDYVALNLTVDSNNILLMDLLQVELIVQIVEFSFYMWLILYLHNMSKNITPFRYLDWAITTPLMLITLSAFLSHDGTTPTRLTDFLSNNASSVIKIVILNSLMLFFGLIGELGILNVYTSTILGFIPFVFNFKFIKDTFLRVTNDIFKISVFYWFVFFWSLYGFFAITSYTTKNTGYNILDIFAKNFFGIFLAYIIWTKSQEKKTES